MAPKYCMIKKCKHFRGRSDNSVQLFCLPRDDDLKSKWLDVFKDFEIGSSNALCVLHFNPNDLKYKNDRYILRTDAIPEPMCCEGGATNVASEDSQTLVEGDNCINCQLLRDEINKLKKQLMNLELAKNVELSVVEVKLAAEKEKKKKYAKENKSLENTLSYYQASQAKLKSIIDDLHQNNLLTDEAASDLKNRTSQSEIVDCLLNGIPHNTMYPANVRDFCMALYYYSPRAYQYVREKFNKNIPHAGTMRSWYANCNVNGEPGITEQSLEVIRERASLKQRRNEKLILAISFDEIHIRKHVQWDQNTKQLFGYCLNEQTENGDMDVANQAMVYMVRGINDQILIPVAYYFIRSMNGAQRASMLTGVIKSVTDCGAQICSITFDGLAANVTMCESLGAKMDPESVDFNPFFENQFDNTKIAIIIDPCHVEKNVRNTIAGKETLYDEKSRKIEWKYFVALEKCSREGDFVIVNKLNRRHIEFKNRKMKVNLAVQTLSNSVADSMEYLATIGHPEFKDSEATIEFIRYFNNLFDVFNSRGFHNSLFKNAICEENKDEILSFMSKAEAYVRGLCIRTAKGKLQSIIKTRVKTAFRGYIINMRSLKYLYQEFVENNHVMDRFRTFYLSQDFVELFFGKIRSLHGYNDNPTVLQFMSAYKRLLCNANIMASSEGNVREFKNINMSSFSNILHVTSRRPRLVESLPIENLIEYTECHDIPIHETLDQIAGHKNSDYLTDQMSCASIAFIAGQIESRILFTSNFYCTPCKSVLIENDKVDRNLIVSASQHVPCMSTYRICKKSDEYLKLLNPQISQNNFRYDAIYLTIFQQLNFDDLFKDSDFTGHDDHKFHLIKSIISEYIRIKVTHMARMLTISAQGEAYRHRLHKLIHFYGQ